jgi:hypothetical protein
VIEVVETASDGLKIIRRDGRLLASRIDPRREAEEWVGRRRVLLEDVKTIFVLGLGAGYHVLALTAVTAARVLVIEPDAELVEAARTIHSFDPARVEFETASSPGGLRASERVRAAVRDSFLVLEHAPSRAADPEFYGAAFALLNGRDWGALTWQWRLKGHAALDATPRLGGAGDTPLTIHDLEQTELVRDSEERERLLLKALRELVK